MKSPCYLIGTIFALILNACTTIATTRCAGESCGWSHPSPGAPQRLPTLRLQLAAC